MSASTPGNRPDIVNEAALLQPVPQMRELRERKKSYGDVPIDTSHPQFNEPLVLLSDHAIAGQAYYSRPNAATGKPVPGVSPYLYLRQSVTETLADINRRLQNPVITDFFGGEVELFVQDALRTIELQTRLHDELFPRIIRQDQPNISAQELARRVEEMIALPSTNPKRPSPHATGGACDVTLRFKQLTFDTVENSDVLLARADADTSEQVYPDYFEYTAPQTDIERAIQRNRRAFYAIMTGATFGIETGLTVNPTEWWHWGRGDQLSARVSGTEPAYYSFAEI